MHIEISGAIAMNWKNVTEAVVALIWNQDKFMICQRPAYKASGFLREWRKESAIALEVGNIFMDVTHEYPDLTVHLPLFNASIREDTPQKLEHNDIR